MQVTIDNRNEALDLPAGTPFTELMQEVCRRAETPGVSVTRVKLNGEDVTGKSWEQYRHLTTGDIASLEIETGSLSTLALETLGSLREFVNQLISELERAAEHFRCGREVEANEIFSRALDGVQVSSHATLLVERNLGLAAENRDSGSREALELMSRTEPILQDMLTAQKAGDWVMLADLIEYELVPNFRDRDRLATDWAQRFGAAVG